MLDTEKKTIAYLTSQYTQSGKIEWIGIRENRGAPLLSVTTVKATEGIGLAGDHYKSKNGKRQVTLIQSEHLEAAASMIGKAEIHPDLVRRNIVVKGINLLALMDKKFRVGTATLEYSGECHPCSRMEENLGHGGYNAMRGHGGITAKILESGEITVGDELMVKT